MMEGKIPCIPRVLLPLTHPNFLGQASGNVTMLLRVLLGPAVSVLFTS